MNIPSRRGFLLGILAAGVAPAIIKIPGLLMPVKPSLLTSARDISIGSAILDATGAVMVRLVGTDINGQRIEETMQMNNGRGASSEHKFWKIEEARVVSWDDAAVFIRDGLGNHVVPSHVQHATMSLFTPEEKVVLRETGWIVPNKHGEQYVLAPVWSGGDVQLVTVKA